MQQPVLLGAVEAVDLVDEQDRPPPARPLLPAPPRSSSRRSATPAITAESAISGSPTSLASSRASVVLPQPGGPHRISDASRPPLQHPRQRRLGPQQLLLADQIGQRARPQPVGQRPVGVAARRRWAGLGLEVGEEVGHGGSLAGERRAVCGTSQTAQC